MTVLDQTGIDAFKAGASGNPAGQF